MKLNTMVHPAITKDVLEVIYNRRSVRSYKETPVNSGDLETILNAGRMAPSALNMQPWRFYVVSKQEILIPLGRDIARLSTKEMIKAGPANMFHAAAHFLHFSGGIQKLRNEMAIFHGAPVVIFITADKNNEWAAIDIGMCAENMMLAAKSLGLDSCPIGLAKFAGKSKNYNRLLIPDSEEIKLAIAMGYGNDVPAAPERKRDNAIFIS